jgi:integrin beta 3
MAAELQPRTALRPCNFNHETPALLQLQLRNPRPLIQQRNTHPTSTTQPPRPPTYFNHEWPCAPLTSTTKPPRLLSFNYKPPPTSTTKPPPHFNNETPAQPQCRKSRPAPAPERGNRRGRRTSTPDSPAPLQLQPRNPRAPSTSTTKPPRPFILQPPSPPANFNNETPYPQHHTASPVGQDRPPPLEKGAVFYYLDPSPF